MLQLNDQPRGNFLRGFLKVRAHSVGSCPTQQKRLRPGDYDCISSEPGSLAGDNPFSFLQVTSHLQLIRFKDIPHHLPPDLMKYLVN